MSVKLCSKTGERVNTSREKINIIAFIHQYIDDGKSKNYETLCSLLKKGLVDDSTMIDWYEQCTKHVILLKKSVHSLVSAMLRRPLSHTSENYLVVYEKFVLSLVSTHSYYADSVLTALSRMFISELPTCDYSSIAIPIATPWETKKFLFTYNIICKVLKLVPLAAGIFLNSIDRGFPYINQCDYVQVFYVSNLLELSLLLPMYRWQILELIIHKIIALDLLATREEIQSRESMEMDFDMDSCKTEILSTEFSESGFKMYPAEADVLDQLLYVLLSYIEKFCLDGQTLKDQSSILMSELLSIFDRHLLTTHGTTHVQFLLFYITSFSQSYASQFIEFLWEKIQNPNTPVIVRLTAASYLGSYLSRFKLISMSLVKSYMKKICDRLHLYIDSHDSSKKLVPDILRHSTFYSLCQIVFYVFAFKHAKFARSPHKMVSLFQSLNLDRIVMSKLNPLKFCNETVVRNFATVTRHYQLMYCYTIIEHNERLGLPEVVMNDNGTIGFYDNKYYNSWSSFPFDPYLLRRSCKFIEPFFCDYVGDFEPVKKDDKKEDEEEMWEASYNPTKQVLELFSYGCSPGFSKSVEIIS